MQNCLRPNSYKKQSQEIKIKIVLRVYRKSSLVLSVTQTICTTM